MGAAAWGSVPGCQLPRALIVLMSWREERSGAYSLIRQLLVELNFSEVRNIVRVELVIFITKKLIKLIWNSISVLFYALLLPWSHHSKATAL